MSAELKVIARANRNYEVLGDLRHQKVFCYTEVFVKDGKTVKLPKDMNGGGVSGADTVVLGTLDEAVGKGKLVGLSLIRPVSVGTKTLVCIDLDWKNSVDGKPDAEQSSLLAEAATRGLLTETTHSGKGAHVWLLADPKQLPTGRKKVDEREIEVFTGSPGQRKVVTLYMTDICGALIETDPTTLPGLSKHTPLKRSVGRPRKLKPLHSPLIKDMLSKIDSAPYDTWVRVGMALRLEFGEPAFVLWDEWSQTASNYDGGTYAKWDSFADTQTGNLQIGVNWLKTTAQAAGWSVKYDIDMQTGMRIKHLTNFRQYVEEAGIVYDTFTSKMMIANDGKLEQVTDSTATQLALRMEKDGFQHNPNISTIDSVMLAVADKNSIDTAHDWAATLKWDKVKRCKNLFSLYFGCDNSDEAYVEAVSLYFACGMAGRLLCGPTGYKADMMVTMTGAQGQQKSTAIKLLAPEPSMFGELDMSKSDDDIARQMRGKLICELPEMVGVSKRQVSHMKAWLSKQVDEWTPKYREFSSMASRRCMLIGTGNEPTYLIDETGNRRYLPLTVPDGTTAKTKELSNDITQIWAEAIVLHKEHGSLHTDAERLALKHLKAAKIRDGVVEDVVTMAAELIMMATDDWGKKANHGGVGLKASSIRRMLMNSPELKDDYNVLLKVGGQMERVIGRALRDCGWINKNIRYNGDQVKVFTPPPKEKTVTCTVLPEQSVR